MSSISIILRTAVALLVAFQVAAALPIDDNSALARRQTTCPQADAANPALGKQPPLFRVKQFQT